MKHLRLRVDPVSLDLPDLLPQLDLMLFAKNLVSSSCVASLLTVESDLEM